MYTPTMTLGGTFLVTTAPAPIVTPRRTVTFAPIQTSLPITIGTRCKSARFLGSIS